MALLIYLTIAAIVAIILKEQSKKENSDLHELMKEEGIDKWIDTNSNGWHFVIFIASIFWLPLLILGYLSQSQINADNTDIDDSSSES